MCQVNCLFVLCIIHPSFKVSVWCHVVIYAVQSFRQMVCAAQRVVRKFLAVRGAQLEVALLQYDTKAELYQTKHTYCARWLEIPVHVKSAVVWSDSIYFINQHINLLQ